MSVKFYYHKLKSLFKNNDFLRIFYNTGWLIGDRFIRLFLGLFIGIWVTRYLGPERFGIYSYALSFSMVFSAIASLGLNNIVVRDLVRDSKNRDVILGTSYWMKFGGALSIIIILAIVLLIIPPLDNNLKILIFIIVASTIFTSFSVIDFYFQSKVFSKYSVIAGIISVIISSIIKVLLIFLEAPLIAFVIVLVIDNVTLALGYWYFYSKEKLSIKSWKFDLETSKSLLSESWPLILSSLAITLGMRIDQIMLHEYIGNSELGIYAVGVRLAEVLTFLPMVISQSIFPKIVSLNFEKDQRKIVLLIRYVFFLLCFLSLIIFLLAHFIVNLLYGEEFIRGYQILQILIWTVPITYLGIITNKLLTVQSLQKIVFKKQLFMAIMNITLNLFLIPIFGIIGAAFATLIADFCINFFMDLAFPKARWIFRLKLKAIMFN